MNSSVQGTRERSVFSIVCLSLMLLTAAELAPQTRPGGTPTPTPTPSPPAAPVATVATEIGFCQFTANWTEVVGATGYLLDVFTGYVPCDQLNIDVGNVTSHHVFERVLCANFQYLVRAYNAAGTSPDSNTIFVGVGVGVMSEQILPPWRRPYRGWRNDRGLHHHGHPGEAGDHARPRAVARSFRRDRRAD